MSFSINIETTDNTATPYLETLIANLLDPAILHTAIAERGETLTRHYLADQATKRHSSANALGATPTGILSRAAESPEGKGSSTEATITMRPAEVLARAFEDIEITPREGKKWLTIPIHRSSYGKRAGEFDDLTFIKFRSGSGVGLAQRASNGNLIFLYLLVKKVTLKQDRTLLPSDDAYMEEAEAAAADVILGDT